MEQLCEAPWNANAMERATLQRLKNSIARYGLVENLVVRPIDLKKYEVPSGNQRLPVLKDLGSEMVPCAGVDLPDAEAKLLGQALNHIHGVDNPGLSSTLYKDSWRP